MKNVKCCFGFLFEKMSKPRGVENAHRWRHMVRLTQRSTITTLLPLLLKFAVCSDPRSVANGYGDCKAILASRKLPRLLLPSTVGRMVVAPSGTIAPVVWAVARVTEVGEHFFVGNLSILTNSGHTLLTIEGLPT